MRTRLKRVINKYISRIGQKGYVDMRPIKVPVEHEGKTRYVSAKRS